jgi:hypothetical protein
MLTLSEGQYRYFMAITVQILVAVSLEGMSWFWQGPVAAGPGAGRKPRAFGPQAGSEAGDRVLGRGCAG